MLFANCGNIRLPGIFGGARFMNRSGEKYGHPPWNTALSPPKNCWLVTGNGTLYRDAPEKAVPMQKNTHPLFWQYRKSIRKNRTGFPSSFRCTTYQGIREPPFSYIQRQHSDGTES